ncbi:MAG: hypothetical protein LBQ28_01635 [Prevotellaceae bacterium]|nr:hypothetical protein [Prevotellaceae bacterium]
MIYNVIVLLLQHRHLAFSTPPSYKCNTAVLQMQHRRVECAASPSCKRNDEIVNRK